MIDLGALGSGELGVRSLCGLVLAVALAGGCEKDPPPAAAPADPVSSEGAEGSASSGAGAPAVVVEDPGTEPTPVEAPPTPEPTFGRTEIVATSVPCAKDEDCAKASCCHATTCVAAADRPDCSSTMCTMDCRAGTMDCNGGCLCQDGTCAAQLWWPPEV